MKKCRVFVVYDNKDIPLFISKTEDDAYEYSKKYQFKNIKIVERLLNFENNPIIELND